MMSSEEYKVKSNSTRSHLLISDFNEPMQPPPAKRARTQGSSSSSSSPPKASTSSSAAKGKGAARRPLGSTLNPSPLRRAHLAQPASGSAAGSQDGSDGSDEDPFAEDEQAIRPGGTRPDASASFITSSTGDAYLLAQASSTKTSDALLSNHIDSPFTLPSYEASLAAFDSHPSLAAQRSAIAAKESTYDVQYFDRWLWEMRQGFNVLLHGFGSKRALISRFAEKARRKGEVILVNGYDPQATLGDIVLAMEEVVKAWERDDEAVESGKKASPRKGASTPTKGRGRATDATPPPQQPKLQLPPSLSALESRIRRLLHSLALQQSPTSSPSPSGPRPTIYILLPSLDGPHFRLPRTLSLLALLVAQPGVSLLASVDHLRSAMLFPAELVNKRTEVQGRPYVPVSSLNGRQSREGTPAADAEKEEEEATTHLLRTYTFLPYHTPTLTPYSLELSFSPLLSKLLPASIFPSSTSSLGGGNTAEGMRQSVGHVLASVTDRAKGVFRALAGAMEDMWEEMGEGGEQKGGKELMPREGQAAPGCAVSLDS